MTTVVLTPPTTTAPQPPPTTAPVLQARPTLPPLPSTPPTTRPPTRPRLDPLGVLPADLTANEYVDAVLGWAERYSVRRSKVDLPALRARVEAATANAVTIADTYNVLEAYLDALGDGHSTLYRPTQAAALTQGRARGFGFQLVQGIVFPFPGGPAYTQGVRDRDALLAVDGIPYRSSLRISAIADTATFTLRRAADASEYTVTLTRGDVTTSLLPAVRSLDDRVGYVDLPGSTGSANDQTTFATTGIEGIRTVDASSPCGWIIDVRRNSGGFPYLMLAAIAPLLGDGPIGGKIDGSGRNTPLSINGTDVVVGVEVVARVAATYRISRPNASIAILTSPITASAGEFATLAFAASGRSRVFGEPTFGVTSQNLARSYPDGSLVAVTTAYDTDRTGRVYDGPLIPDTAIANDWSNFATPSDPVLQSAVSWIRATCPA